MILIPKKITWFLGIVVILAFGLSGLLINNSGLTIFGIVFVGLLVVNQFYQPYAYTSRGEEQLRQGNYLKVIEDYNQAEIIKPHSPVSRYDFHAKDQLGYYGVGIALTRLGYNLSAFEAFQRAAKLHFELRNEPLHKLIQKDIRSF